LSVWYGGRCRDVYEDGVCGLHMPGMRLFAGPDGNGTCDCDTGEGWLRHNGRCYQEFTPAFCEDGKVLNLGTKKKPRAGEFDCIKNPCDDNSLAHRTTWHNRYCHPKPEVDDLDQCELYVSNEDENGSPLKCCSPGKRKACSNQDFIQSNSLPPGCKRAGTGGKCCKQGDVYSLVRKECIKGFK